MHQQRSEEVIAMTTVTLSKWGNSSAVRIPNQFIKQLNLTEGTELEAILTKENHILLKPLALTDSQTDLRDHLQLLLSQIKEDTARHEEIDFGIEGEELI